MTPYSILDVEKMGAVHVPYGERGQEPNTVENTRGGTVSQSIVKSRKYTSHLRGGEALVVKVRIQLSKYN